MAALTHLNWNTNKQIIKGREGILNAIPRNRFEIPQIIK